MATEVNKILLDIEVDSKGVITNLDQVQKKLKGVGVDLERAGKQFQNFSKEAKDGSSAAGIAGAAATEFGRVISDLPYGITAITNNVSQLGSMFSLLVVKTGGVTQALGALLKVMRGPAGVLILFQIAVALVELWAQKQNKAKRETEDFSNALILQKNILDSVRNSFMDGNKDVDERIRLLQTLALTDKNLQNILKDSTLTDEEKIKKGEEYVDNIKAVEQAEKDLLEARKAIEKDGRSLDELTAEREEKKAERLALRTLAQTSVDAATILGAEIEIALRDSQIAKLDGLIQKYEFVDQQLIASAKLRETYAVDDPEKREKTAIEGTIQAIKDKIGKLEEQRDTTGTTLLQIRKYNEQIEFLKKQLEELERGGVIQRVTNSLGEQGVVLGKALVDGPQLTEAQKIAKDALKKVGKAAVDGFQEFAEETASAREGGDDDWLLKTLGVTPGEFKEKADKIQAGLNAAFDLVDAQFQRDIALEEAKTIAINDQLRERLRNEQLTAEQRDKINQEIAKNEAALVEQKNKIEKKRFQLNKAQGIANAVINTAVAITEVAPNLPLMAFIGALGAAQVATIASQAFVPQASPTPNLSAQGLVGAEGAGGAEPQFNVIGATGQNQLVAAIAAAQQQPVRAYVVSNEVTTAQSLDRNIVSEASL
jgi:hypothetical protein